MKFLKNFCHPKDDHFQNQAKHQTYKPVSEFIHESRNRNILNNNNKLLYGSSDNNNNRNFNTSNNYNNGEDKFEYKGWNHPYSASGYYRQQNQYQNANYPYNNNNDSNYSNGQNKKISFKDFSQALCGTKGDGPSNNMNGKPNYRDEDQQFQIKVPKTGNNYRSPYTDTQYSRNYYSNYQQYEQDMSRKLSNRRRDQSSIPTREAPYFTPMHGDPQNQSVYLQKLQNLNNTMTGKENQKLKDQNKILKRLIQEEYKPLKQLYSKLITEQQERDYLISKLQWKVNELKKQSVNTKQSFAVSEPPIKQTTKTAVYAFNNNNMNNHNNANNRQESFSNQRQDMNFQRYNNIGNNNHDIIRQSQGHRYNHVEPQTTIQPSSSRNYFPPPQFNNNNGNNPSVIQPNNNMVGINNNNNFMAKNTSTYQLPISSNQQPSSSSQLPSRQVSSSRLPVYNPSPYFKSNLNNNNSNAYGNHTQSVYTSPNKNILSNNVTSIKRF